MSEALVTLPDGRKAKITFDSREQLDATIADLAKGGSKADSGEKASSWGPSAAWSGIKGFAKDVVSDPGSYASASGQALRSEGHGVVDPMVGIGQAVAHVVGQGDRADQFVQNREASIQAERAKAGDTGTDWFRGIGNAMAPTNYLIPGGGGANALARIGTAAAAGAAANATMPVTSGDSYLGEKAKQAGAGAAAGGVLGIGAELVGAAIKPLSAAARAGVDGLKRWLGAEMPSSLQSTAVHKVLETFGRDEAAGGPKLTEVMDALNTARAADKPMSLADMGSGNVKALAGYLTRQPGESMGIANKALDTRDAAAGQRLHSDITKYVSGGDSMKQTADALTQARSDAAKPLYEEAMKPGSTAPLQEQFNAEFGRIQAERSAAQREVAAAERQQTSTASRQSNAGNVGDLSVRGTDARAADNRALATAKEKLSALDAQEAKTTEVLRESQRAAAAGERGGVWSPRIQQFLDDPIMKQGISKGLQVQRLESLAQGKPFNATDYAVKGTSQDGEPVLGAVPNMRLLDSAKRGLDEILEGYRNTTTGKLVLDQRGRAIDQVRQAFVGELDRLNPSYKAARASWAGPSQSLDAMHLGKDIFQRSPEEIAALMKDASPNDKEFIRLGVADKLRQQVDSTGFGGDEAKALIKNERNKQQFRALFDSPEQADKFIDSVMAENKMFRTNQDLRGNSATARRLAGDEAFSADMQAAGHGLSAAKNSLSGRIGNAAIDMWRMKQALGWRKNQALNAEIAKLLFDPALTQDALQAGAGQRLLNNFPGPNTQNMLAHMTRQRLQQLAPAAGAIAPGLFSPGTNQ